MVCAFSADLSEIIWHEIGKNVGEYIVYFSTVRFCQIEMDKNRTVFCQVLKCPEGGEGVDVSKTAEVTKWMS